MTEQQRQELDQLLHEEPYEGVRDVVKTWFEQGEEAGQRAILSDQLEIRFGSLTDEARARLQAMSAEELRRLGKSLMTAQSLKELDLED